MKEGRRAGSSTSLSPLSFWASSSPSCRRVRVVVDSRMSSRASSMTSRRPGPGPPLATVPDPPPGLPPRPSSKMDHFSIVRCVRIGHFSARSAPVPFWDLGRPGAVSDLTLMTRLEDATGFAEEVLNVWPPEEEA